ncbi:shikimate kinase [Candidatus Kaiserbacteria bacterium]|nr:shikimate kinase [Candidatus Kaiserbacteria bacterium]
MNPVRNSPPHPEGRASAGAISNGVNIVLIGMRGSGKTTVAKMLSKRLGWDFLELDEEIAKKVGMPISDFVAKEGWDAFRDKESEVVAVAAASDKVVISTGGGVVVREKNIEALKKSGICIFFQASVDSLFKHIGGEGSKLPRLTGNTSMREELEEVLKVRQQLYEKAADEIIDTETLSLDDMVENIVQIMQKRRIT